MFSRFKLHHFYSHRLWGVLNNVRGLPRRKNPKFMSDDRHASCKNHQGRRILKGFSIEFAKAFFNCGDWSWVNLKQRLSNFCQILAAVGVKFGKERLEGRRDFDNEFTVRLFASDNNYTVTTVVRASCILKFSKRTAFPSPQGYTSRSLVHSWIRYCNLF